MIIPLVCILQCWRTTLKPDWYAGTYTVVCSSCHHNLQCGNFKLFFVVVLFLFVLFCFCFRFCVFLCRGLHGIVLKCVLHVAAQFSVLARPIKFLITGVVISDPIVDPNTHS